MHLILFEVILFAFTKLDRFGYARLPEWCAKVDHLESEIG